MKKFLMLFGLTLGVIGFTKVSGAEAVNAQDSANYHSALEDFCPNEGESCIVNDPVIIKEDSNG